MISASDHEDILNLARAGDHAGLIKEQLGLTLSERQIQRIVTQSLGRRPRRAATSIRENWLKRAVINYLVEAIHLRSDYCSQCQSYCGTDVYVRQLNHFEDKLDGVAIIGKCCKRPGDF